MKILVLQLARLGDIYQTWPVLRSLERAGHEIHVLVRPRFAEAMRGLSAVSRMHLFDSKALLSPTFLDPENGLAESMQELDRICDKLDRQAFDRVINLSFSPLSSWLTFELEQRAWARGAAIGVAGYSRHVDGFLAIPDDASAYFYAQVGVRAANESGEAPNRISLARLFAVVAGVDLLESDWRGPDHVKVSAISPTAAFGDEPFVAVHIGASQENKTLSAEAWGEIVRAVARRFNMRVALLGAEAEAGKAEEIVEKAVEAGGIAKNAVLSLVGRTSLSEVFSVLQNAKLLVAGDSALLHMASLLGKPVLNLSSRAVSHWETGPVSRGSRILLYGGAGPAAETVVLEVGRMLGVLSGSQADRVIEGPLDSNLDQGFDRHSDFLWQLVSAIYMGGPVPAAPDLPFVNAVAQWAEIAEIEKLQLEALQAKRGDAKLSLEILDRVDSAVDLLIQGEPRLAPIQRWWNTEKTRCGPQSQENLLAFHMKLNSQLSLVLEQWYGKSASPDVHNGDSANGHNDRSELDVD